MSDELESLKRNVSILSLAESYGVKFKRVGGSEYQGRCPFPDHEDKTPSFSVSGEKNCFKCFGCDRGGSVLDLIMYIERVNTSEAIRILKQRYGPPPPEKERRSAPEPASKRAELLSPTSQKLISRVIETYHNTLKSSSRPVEYLLKRKIRQGELIDQCRVGYSDGSLVGKLTEKDKEVLKTHGLLGERDHGDGNITLYEHFKDSIVFPIVSEAGQITEIYGRCLNKYKGKHIYLPGPHQGIFNPKALNHKEIFLCEGILDALSLMSLGHPNVTASFGINGFTEEMLKMFVVKGIERVMICYDNDRPAEKATFLLAEKFKNVNIEAYQISFPYKDANDFLCKSHDPQEGFRKLTSQAKPLWVKPQKTDEYHQSWELKGSEYHFTFTSDYAASTGGDRLYIARGLDKNKTNVSLKLFLKMSYENRFHIDNSIDLFSARLSLGFCKSAGLVLDLDAKVIKHDLDKITQVLDQELIKQVQDKDDQKKLKFQKDIAISLKAREFLKDPLMIVRFAKHTCACGLVGEPLNAFFCFLATLSRHLADQLHLIIQSESSAGKSTMLNLISSFVPEDELIYLTQITPKSFYYMNEEELMGKVIAIAELDGADQAIYPIKQMMSEKKLSISYTRTDPLTGEHTSVTNKKDAVVSFLLTSPKEGGDEEVDNRSVILTQDESENQTKRIQEVQRLFRSPEGVKLKREKERLVRFYNHVQKEIKPLTVVNPYSNHLSFKADNHRSRRDHEKYLILIECVSLLFQYQREQASDGRQIVKTHLIDIVLAHFLARRIFKATLDELPPQTRSFFKKVIEYLQAQAEAKECDILDIWITRKQLREFVKLSNTRVHEHISRLISYEYMSSKREAYGFRYRLSFRPDEDSGQLSNNLSLASISSLKKKASEQEREEYEKFVPYFKEIFCSLDSNYTDGEH